ncbi:MAG: hypothetical protein HYY52_07700 [Candidatus Melainabacteria bacterium]|nr:hypothetical protein [Candidatus Melainabacteria bacterium]
MAVIAVIAIVLGLLYAYSDQGWRLFYQSYGRGLLQVKAKVAIKAISEELREANKKRIAINSGSSFGVPLPDDAKDSSPYIYFTKPVIFEPSGDVISYNYILYYFAKPKRLQEDIIKGIQQEEKYLILKSIKFLNQSKHYTEDEEKSWPFLPPILEIQKSSLPEDKEFIDSLKQDFANPKEETTVNESEDELFIDHFAKLKKESRNIPISGNFLANSLTDPFTTNEVNIYFGKEYKTDKPIKIKVSLEESSVLFGLMGAMSEFEVEITPRN